MMAPRRRWHRPCQVEAATTAARPSSSRARTSSWAAPRTSRARLPGLPERGRQLDGRSAPAARLQRRSVHQPSTASSPDGRDGTVSSPGANDLAGLRRSRRATHTGALSTAAVARRLDQQRRPDHDDLRSRGGGQPTGSAGSWWSSTARRRPTDRSRPRSRSAPERRPPGGCRDRRTAPGTVYHARSSFRPPLSRPRGEDVAFTTIGTPAPAGAAGGAAGGTVGTVGTVTGGTKATTVIKPKAKAKKQCVVPKVTGKKLNKARSTVYAKGCKVQVKYVKSKKPNNTVLTQSRKAGKKLGYRSVVKLTVAKKAAAL